MLAVTSEPEAVPVICGLIEIADPEASFETTHILSQVSQLTLSKKMERSYVGS